MIFELWENHAISKWVGRTQLNDKETGAGCRRQVMCNLTNPEALVKEEKGETQEAHVEMSRHGYMGS